MLTGVFETMHYPHCEVRRHCKDRDDLNILDFAPPSCGEDVYLNFNGYANWNGTGPGPRKRMQMLDW
jgi:hypothetical protein